MSAVQVRVEKREKYWGAEGIFYAKDEEEYATVFEEMDTKKTVEASVFAPEICGLTITGILSLLAIIVSLALNSTVLSLIFTIPLVGVLLGSGYIGYLKKYGKYH